MSAGQGLIERKKVKSLKSEFLVSKWGNGDIFGGTNYFGW